MRDKKLVKLASAFRRGMLGGEPSEMMCAAVCMPLCTLLEVNGVRTVLMESQWADCSHVWLRLPDGRVLDPTLDQFDASLPEVYLGPPTKYHASPQPFIMGGILCDLLA